MNLNFILIVTLLLFCNLSKLICQEETTKESEETDSQAGSVTKQSNSKESDDSTTESTKPEEPELTKKSSKEESNSNCTKTCHKNSVRKFQNQCVSVKYKSSEKAKTKEDCLDKCKKESVCASSTFIKPRSPTTYDLKTLYKKVIDSENWVSLKKPANIYKYYEEYEKDMKDSTENLDKGEESDYDDGPENYALVNSSALKTVSQVMGSCFLYDDKLPEDVRLECTPSHLTFTYDDIQCIEDPNCIRPRKQCTRGKCGPLCKDFNYIHIPHACMGKYFFGHLTANDIEKCIEFCLATPDCKSIDFGNMGSCLLNYVTRNDTQLVLGCDSKNNEEWDYYEILEDSECLFEKPRPSPNEDTCTNMPGICKNGGNCESIQLPPPQQSFTYGCHCPCNWCGKHCDKLNMKTFKNGCLNGSVLVWSVAENSGDCIDMCLDEIHCKSVSYSATSGTCALHWADHETQPIVSSPHCPTYRTDIIEREWTFYEIICNTSTCHSTIEVIEAKELKGCTANPCLNGGECADIFQSGKVIGYHCQCKCGYCGDRCENHNFVQTTDACIWGSHLSNTPSDYYRKSVPLSTCLNVCASKFPLCRSVDYSNKGECLLNNRDSDIAVLTKKCNNYMRQRWSLYDMSCVCNNRPVLY